jgi:hypothetical protein
MRDVKPSGWQGGRAARDAWHGEMHAAPALVAHVELIQLRSDLSKVNARPAVLVELLEDGVLEETEKLPVRRLTTEKAESVGASRGEQGVSVGERGCAQE